MAACSHLLIAENADLLVASVVAAGGSNITKRNFINGRIEHSGGCIVAWQLTAPSGQTMGSEIESHLVRGKAEDLFAQVSLQAEP
jgi:hypothetical protein